MLRVVRSVGYGFLVASSFAGSEYYTNKKTIEKVLGDANAKKHVCSRVDPELCSEMGIKKPVIAIETSEEKVASALGCSLGGGQAVVLEGLEFQKLPKKQREFVLRHELAHIARNDNLKRFSAIGVSAVAMDVIAKKLPTYAKLTLLPPMFFVSCWGAFFPYSQYLEKQADLLACDHCSLDQKKAACSLFQDVLKRDASVCKKIQGEIDLIATKRKELEMYLSGEKRLRPWSTLTMEEIKARNALFLEAEKIMKDDLQRFQDRSDDLGWFNTHPTNKARLEYLSQQCKFFSQ